MNESESTGVPVDFGSYHKNKLKLIVHAELEHQLFMLKRCHPYALLGGESEAVWAVHVVDGMDSWSPLLAILIPLLLLHLLFSLSHSLSLPLHPKVLVK